MMEQTMNPIVVAVDGSEPGWDAMHTALYLAGQIGRPVDVLHVIRIRKSGYFAFIDRHLHVEFEANAQKVLNDARQRAQEAGVEVRTHLLEGEKDPAEAIVNYLEEAGPVKFLVLGTFGLGFMGRHILGSTTERVIREVTHRGLSVPILVVPPSKTVPM
jgi:nucleotide-binding universal stress UspA family protein